MNELTLFHFWRSSASWRVRWALEIKRLAYTSEPVDLLKGEEKADQYKKINPAGYVPCLLTAQGPLCESLAIIEWLEETYPQPSLYPKDAFLKAKIRQIAETINAGIQPLQNPDVTKKISTDNQVQNEWIQFWITRGLTVVEDLLRELRSQSTAIEHSYCYGQSPTLADLCLIPQCYAANRFGVDLNRYPLCNGVYQHSLSSFECAASHPERFKPATT